MPDRFLAKLYDARKFYGVLGEELDTIVLIIVTDPFDTPYYDEEGYAVRCLVIVLDDKLVSSELINEAVELLEKRLPKPELAILTLKFSLKGRKDYELVRTLISRGYNCKGELELTKFWA